MLSADSKCGSGESSRALSVRLGNKNTFTCLLSFIEATLTTSTTVAA